MSKSNKIAIDKRALEADPVGVLEKQGVNVEDLIKHTITRALGNTATAEMRDFVNAKKLDYLQSRIDELTGGTAESAPDAPAETTQDAAPAPKPQTFDELRNEVVAENKQKFALKYATEEIQSHKAREAALEQTEGKAYAALRRDVLNRHDDKFKTLDEAAKVKARDEAAKTAE